MKAERKVADMPTNPRTRGASVPPLPARRLAIGEDQPSGVPDGDPPHPTRAALVWTATVAVLVLLGPLIVFILQNQEEVYVEYFGLAGSVPLGIALSIAAVAGGFLVAITGAIRIAQLRTTAARLRHRAPTRPKIKAQGHLFRHGHPAR